MLHWGCDIIHVNMGLFGGKKEEHFEGMLGVDIGSSCVKVVELTPEVGRLRLSTYGYSEPALNAAAALNLDEPKRLADILQQIVKASGMKATKAVAALPGSSVFHAIISVPIPRSSKEDLKPVIEAQASKLLPLPLAEMVLDSHVLDKDLLPKDGAPEKPAEEKKEGAPKFIRVQVTGAPKTLVAKYVEVFKQAKIELVSLETEAFALIRALVGKDASRVMIVDIGAERTNVLITEKGIPFLTRGIKSGGTAVTQALASTMGIGAGEAEMMKKDMAYSNAGMSPAIEAALKPLVHELKYALQLYAEQEFHDNRSVDKVILTGGSSMLPGLDAYLTTALNANVYLGDPWARIATQPEARPVLDEVGSRFAVSIGLAMRLKDDKV